jgi:NDP-sugar pyrophosphorylase family protein
MKAVIFPTAKTDDLEPLTSWLPEFLLPVVNKPVVEHLIELLARQDVKEIMLILKHMPYETEQYFGDGSRWGVQLSYALLGSYRGVIDALRRVEAEKLDGRPLLCLPANIVMDLDVFQLLDIQRQGGGDICLAQMAVSGDQDKLFSATDKDLQDLDTAPSLLTEHAYRLLVRVQTSATPPPLPDLIRTAGLTANVCHLPFSLQPITSPTDLLMVNGRVLEGHFKRAIIPGKMVEPGIWLGKRCKIHPRARLEAPVLIGNHCNVQGGASVGSGSVVGDRVIIDEGASVRASLVLDRTYVGAYTEIKEAIVKKNWMLQIPTLLHVQLGDDMILGDLDKRTLTTRGERLLNVLLALILLVVTSPLLIILFLYHLVFPPRKFFAREKRFGGYEQVNLEGEMAANPFDLFVFRSKSRFFRKLPGLLNVIKGELNLVGVTPLSDEECRELPEEWKKMRTGAPVGLFHLWELEKRDDLEWEEKMIMDSYYAASRSLWGDVKTFLKCLFASS